MPIQPLSVSDIRALGSSLVLNDARSVIKELVDNALDAYANNISIEISANTVDVIQVKDNGSGIGAEDRNLLCKRGCTSKIRTIQDLENLGGSFLGFRGEALASLVGLSSAVLVTTRTDGEPAGSVSKFGLDGQLLRQASHPVGTTVRVQDFLQTIPVRRQTAVKAASRTLTDVRKILQAFAFARPNVRISFKVLKARSDKYNWTYGPTPGSTTLLDATAKILGKEVAAQCEARLWKSEVGQEAAANAHSVDAVVAKVGDDPRKVGNKGYFISIDGRPISSTRGVFKDFVNLYKAYYRHRVSVTKSEDCSVDPFLCLHLQCPAASYDVNIEPAKDEVLFADARGVLDLLEKFLKSTYGNLPEKTEMGCPSRNRDLSRMSEKQSFDLLLARKDHHSNPTDTAPRDQGFEVINKKSQEPHANAKVAANASPVMECGQDGDSAVENSTISTGRPTRNMYDFDEDDPSTTEHLSSPEQTSQVEPDEADLQKVSVTNPWSIAKLNASTRSTTSPQSRKSSVDQNEQLMTPGVGPSLSNAISRTRRDPFAQVINLPSPARSARARSRSPPPYLNPGPPLGRRAPAHQSEQEDEIQFTQESENLDSTRGCSSSPQSWEKPRVPNLQVSPNPSSQTTDKDDWFRPREDSEDRGAELAQTEASSTQLTDPTEETSQISRLRNSIRMPFVSPFKTPQRPPSLHPPVELTPTISAHSQSRWPTRQPGLRIQGERLSTSPSGHVHPAPLTQSHAHPMASPPRLDPSPPQISRPPRQTIQNSHPDLEEIMDFEYRKKAVNAQRRNQSKLTNRNLNPGRLAQIQRQSATSPQEAEMVMPATNSTQWPIARPTLNAAAEEEDPAYNPASCRDQQTPDKHPPSIPNQTSNPARSRPLPPLANQDPLETNDPDNSPPRIPAHDPRAYLMQHHRDLSKPTQRNTAAPKLHRIKTSKLPLETIPSHSALHPLLATPLMPFPSSQTLAVRTNELAGFDAYVATGRNGFVCADWDGRGRGGLVEGWEERIGELVRGKGGGGEEEEEEMPVNVRVRLGVVLRAHCEMFG